ncbi:MAG: tetratricopeptide repeat protein [Verrucomicrobia subdivision 3 bacterium]|nr:tetratricopeptide repeat protein [Limisphaerales bacterium]
MPEKTVNEISRELRELYQKGTMALQRQNFEYAIAIFNQVLTREPAFFECRQALRAAQFKEAGGRTSFFKKVIGGASSSPLVAKGQLALRKNPLEAMQIAEQILSGDPYSTAGHKLLADAALEADLAKTACMSLEILLKNSPKDFDLSMQYGRALAAAGQAGKAEDVYTDLMQAYPTRGEVADALKDLSARRTLNEGGYEALADGSGSYRDILKNKAEAEQLEQEKREVKSDDVAQRLIYEYEQRLPREPKNLKLLRELAELYAQKKDFNRALEYCERIRSSEGGTDPSLDKLISDVTLKKYDYALERLDQSAPDFAEQAARIQTERDEYHLSETKARAERYPTDLQIRFDLGELYFKAGKVTEAIQEFQKAQNNPNKRLQAMGYLGQCYARRGMNDMAARALQNAIKEKLVFDSEKKELVYQLGSVLEKMGKPDEAIEQFKQIYEVDIGYKDVAAKVDAYYSGT